MALLQSARRPLTNLASRAVTKPTTTYVAPRSAISAVFNSECRTRSFGTSTLATSSSRLRLRKNVFGSVQPQSPSTQFIRRRSDDSESMRQWGFEDINARLPQDPAAASPSQTPQKNLILVDVREPAELNSTGIIPSAVSVPLASQPDAYFLTNDEFETRFGYPKPGAEGQQLEGDIVFYCKAGVRARAAAQLAVQAGYDPARIGVYDGSWLDWMDKGGKVERWEGPDYD